MSKEIVGPGNPFQVEYVDRSYGGARRMVIEVDGDGAVTMGDLTVDADGVVSIAGTAVLSGTVSDNLSMASGKDITFAGGASDLDMSLSSGVFKTPTGQTTLNGAVSLASGKDIVFAGGASDLDMSLSSGILKGPTGLTTFAGKIAATASAWAITDPGNAGAIPVTSSGVCAMTSAGAETRTLAIPTFVGQQLTLICDTYVGNIVVTSAQAINQAGNTTMTFGAAADYIKLEAATVGGALRWRVAANDGTALS